MTGSGAEGEAGAGLPAEERLETFLARYDPTIAELAIRLREKLRSILPPALELVYDNYNALVIGFSPSESSSDAVVSIALYPRWIRLFFLQGADLPDPDGLLEGSGKQVRNLRLDSVERLDDPAVRALIGEAVARGPQPFRDVSARRLIIKSVSAKRRPRRPA